jgi:hypothetical protein
MFVMMDAASRLVSHPSTAISPTGGRFGTTDGAPGLT